MTDHDLFSVAGKVVIVTGAARGIGRALALGFLAAGATVIPVLRRPAAAETGDPLDSGGRWRPLLCDLADTQALHALPEEALRAGEGTLDVLVNNAGVTFEPGDDPYDPEIQRATQAVLLDAPYYLCGRIAPQMAAQGGGSIINVTSINAHLAFPGNPAYVASKGGLRMLTKAVARDFGSANVRANNLCPGYIHTDMTAKSHADDERHKLIRSHTVLERWGRVEDLVGPALFLASDASAYVTGIDLFVDGGWSAKGL